MARKYNAMTSCLFPSKLKTLPQLRENARNIINPTDKRQIKKIVDL